MEPFRIGVQTLSYIQPAVWIIECGELPENVSSDEVTSAIQEVLGRGERLDSVMQKSSNLRMASGKYAKNAKYLNTQALLRKYGPLVFALMLVVGGFYLRFFR